MTENKLSDEELILTARAQGTLSGMMLARLLELMLFALDDTPQAPLEDIGHRATLLISALGEPRHEEHVIIANAESDDDLQKKLQQYIDDNYSMDVEVEILRIEQGKLMPHFQSMKMP